MQGKIGRPRKGEQRINIRQDESHKFWSERFGVTTDRLREAVRKVGVIADDIEAELNRMRNANEDPIPSYRNRKPGEAQ